jgi:3,4-dihydroxy 2-butanone 4-phosphate synthase/GTP cyclohydrolase II
MEAIERLAVEAAGFALKAGRPLVTLAYAQSLDGCIAIRKDQQLQLSGSESHLFTHQLRAAHDAILVGIGTVLADDPRLTARLVNGPHPQPIVLDCCLRIPSDAKILHGLRPAYVAVTQLPDPQKAASLQANGTRLVYVKEAQPGMVDLEDLLHQLFSFGIRSLMVEGGGQVITSFLQQKLVDQLALTIAPVFVGGYHAYNPLREPGNLAILPLREVEYIQLGNDVIVWGKLND